MATNANVMATVRFRRPLGYWGVGRLGMYLAKWHKLKLRNGPPGDLEFVLSPSTIRKGYRFDTNDPIWVHVDNGDCPPQRSSHPDIQNIRSSPTCVTVYNAKVSGPIRLRYQLNVLDGSGNREPIDPIIEN